MAAAIISMAASRCVSRAAVAAMDVLARRRPTRAIGIAAAIAAAAHRPTRQLGRNSEKLGLSASGPGIERGDRQSEKPQQ
ncbi:hypothetical protein [Methylosinus sp. LW4]|uniref:hypothetical protein n=1 Tax=Methylosinus sp. LW4 TaxID=136993 RepID=UPI0012F7B101|nr:hypothetical protein [Methylosinus sp. LW4]